jgi:hypothetical protein
MPIAADMRDSTAVIGTRMAETAVACFGAAVLLFGAVLWTFHSPQIQKTDFTVTYIGSRIVYEGNGPKLYDLAEQQRLRALFLSNAEALIYEHPPFEALLFSPLAALPYRTAYLIWGCINAALWLWLPFLLRRHIPVPDDNLSYLALWICFAPLGVALYQGQSSLLLVLSYALAFIQLKNKKELSAGLCLGLGLFKFQFVIPFALIFLFRRKWKFTIGFALIASALAVLSLIAVGRSGVVSYVSLLSAIAGNPKNISYGAATDMATVQGFIHALLARVATPATIRVVVTAISAGLILFTSWIWHQSDQEDVNGNTFDLMFALAVVASLVTGFHMFTHDLSPLILAMLLVVAHFPLRGGVLRSILRFSLLLFWIPVTYFALIEWHCMYLLFAVLIAFAAAVVMLARKSQEFATTANIVASTVS